MTHEPLLLEKRDVGLGQELVVGVPEAVEAGRPVQRIEFGDASSPEVLVEGVGAKAAWEDVARLGGARAVLGQVIPQPGRDVHALLLAVLRDLGPEHHEGAPCIPADVEPPQLAQLAAAAAGVRGGEVEHAALAAWRCLDEGAQLGGGKRAARACLPSRLSRLHAAEVVLGEGAAFDQPVRKLPGSREVLVAGLHGQIGPRTSPRLERGRADVRWTLPRTRLDQRRQTLGQLSEVVSAQRLATALTHILSDVLHERTPCGLDALPRWLQALTNRVLLLDQLAESALGDSLVSCSQIHPPRCTSELIRESIDPEVVAVRLATPLIATDPRLYRKWAQR